MKKPLEGIVISIFVGRDPEALEKMLVPNVRVTLEGFEGDKHAGLTRLADVRVSHYPEGAVIRNTRQVSIVSREELEQIAKALNVSSVSADWLGANLNLLGIPNLTQLPPSTRLFFPQDAVLVIDGENEPCIGPGRVIQNHYPDVPRLVSAFPKAAIHKRGLVAWVERAGMIVTGDTVRVDLPPQIIYSY
jgi:hypothetical protein